MRKYYAALDDDAWPVQMGLRCVFGRRDYRPALDQLGGTRRRTPWVEDRRCPGKWRW
jgi:hypothetical protein